MISLYVVFNSSHSINPNRAATTADVNSIEESYVSTHPNVIPNNINLVSFLYDYDTRLRFFDGDGNVYVKKNNQHSLY